MVLRALRVPLGLLLLVSLEASAEDELTTRAERYSACMADAYDASIAREDASAKAVADGREACLDLREDLIAAFPDDRKARSIKELEESEAAMFKLRAQFASQRGVNEN